MGSAALSLALFCTITLLLEGLWVLILKSCGVCGWE